MNAELLSLMSQYSAVLGESKEVEYVDASESGPSSPLDSRKKASSVVHSKKNASSASAASGNNKMFDSERDEGYRRPHGVSACPFYDDDVRPIGDDDDDDEDQVFLKEDEDDDEDEDEDEHREQAKTISPLNSSNDSGIIQIKEDRAGSSNQAPPGSRFSYAETYNSDSEEEEEELSDSDEEFKMKTSTSHTANSKLGYKFTSYVHSEGDREAFEEAMACREVKRPSGKPQFGMEWDYSGGDWIGIPAILAAPSKHGYTPEQAHNVRQR